MMSMLPQVLISPFARALVDRWNRRQTMIVADGLIALAVIVLAALYALDAVQIWHVYVVMFVRAIGGAFHSRETGG
jgi:DHA3 family macrolide efflux protein-like MFS transporter